MNFNRILSSKLHRPTPEQRAALLAAVQERRKTTRNVSPDYISSRLTFQLNSGAVVLRRGAKSNADSSDEGCDLAQMKFTSLNFVFTQFPGLHGFSLDIKLATLLVKDLYTPHSNFRKLVGPKASSIQPPDTPGSALSSTVVETTGEELGRISAGEIDVYSSSDPFFSARFASRRIDGTRKLSLNIRFQPLDVVINKQLLLLVTSLFSMDSVSQPTKQPDNFLERTAPPTRSPTTSGYSMDLSLDISAPQVWMAGECNVDVF